MRWRPGVAVKGHGVPGVKDRLGHKVGPLPVYGWAIVAVVGYLGYKHFAGASTASTASTTANTTPTTDTTGAAGTGSSGGASGQADTGSGASAFDPNAFYGAFGDLTTVLLGTNDAVSGLSAQQQQLAAQLQDLYTARNQTPAAGNTTTNNTYETTSTTNNSTTNNAATDAPSSTKKAATGAPSSTKTGAPSTGSVGNQTAASAKKSAANKAVVSGYAQSSAANLH